jgi:hypothetical protein
MVPFVAPRQQDLQLTHDILQVFEGASGLGCNMVKYQLAPIRCSEEQSALVVTLFLCQKVDFPLKYLGLPLSTSKLPKSAVLPLADQIVDKLPAWKGMMLQRSGRLTLIKTTPCVVPIYSSINISLPGWLIKAIQKILKAFLWFGSDVMHKGKSGVAWSRVQRPLHLGGLGIMDLRLLGIALRARWLWLHYSDPDRSWAVLPPSEDAMTVAFFNASIQMTLGSGEALFFWTDLWLQDMRLADIALELRVVVAPRLHKRHLVACVLRDNSWTHDITGTLTVPVLLQYLDVWPRLRLVQLRLEVADSFTWRWEGSDAYSYRSFYKALCSG